MRSGKWFLCKSTINSKQPVFPSFFLKKKEIAGHQEMVPDEINHALSFELVQGLLGTLDSEWSRLAVRGLLSSMLSGICALTFLSPDLI